VTKFVGKFRKNKEYNDDYGYIQNKHQNERVEIKKILTQHEEELAEESYVEETYENDFNSGS